VRTLTLKKNHGFTLVESVVVIVLLGITAVTFTTMITGAMRGYLDTANRQDSAAIARIALDRMGRELREAMPLSIRVSGDGKCVQFLPINTSFVYATLTAGNAAVQVIEPLPGYSAPIGTFYAAVYPLNTTELYSLQAMKSVTINGVASGLRSLTLASAFTSPYPRSGPGQRLYIVGRPVSFCITAGGQLSRLVNDVAGTQPSTALVAETALLVDKVDYANSFFTNSASTWQNNSLIKIVLAIKNPSAQYNNETLSLDHEVWVRNVQ
jgi:MSHA biogenesis protein MshO